MPVTIARLPSLHQHREAAGSLSLPLRVFCTHHHSEATTSSLSLSFGSYRFSNMIVRLPCVLLNGEHAVQTGHSDWPSSIFQLLTVISSFIIKSQILPSSTAHSFELNFHAIRKDAQLLASSLGRWPMELAAHSLLQSLGLYRYVRPSLGR